MGARAHMTGRAMDPLPSPAVSAAAEAEAGEEADPPATGRARGPWPCVESRGRRTWGPPVRVTPLLARREHPGASLFPPLPGTLLSGARLARGRVETSGSFRIPPCRRSSREWFVFTCDRAQGKGCAFCVRLFPWGPRLCEPWGRIHVAGGARLELGLVRFSQVWPNVTEYCHLEHWLKEVLL